jgi:hypothetical protein
MFVRGVVGDVQMRLVSLWMFFPKHSLYMP